MKKTGKTLLYALSFLFFFTSQAYAQVPVFLAPTDTVQFSAPRYVAHIRVQNFKKLVGVQFTLTWDPTVITLDSVGNFGMPMNYENNFGMMDAEKGHMRFAWNEPKLQGADLKDETILFSMYFRPLGKAESISPLRFTDDPTVREAVDASFNAIPAEFRHGAVRLREAAVTSVESNFPERFALRQAFPNPLSAGQELYISFYTHEAGPVAVSVMDIEGRVLFRQMRSSMGGMNQLELSSAIFPVSGIYIVQLRQGEKFSTQRVLFQ